MKIRWGVDGFDNTYTFEIPDQDIEGLNEKERRKLINEYVDEEAKMYVSLWWEEVDP